MRNDKPPEWRRWLGIALRTAHIAAIALLAAQLLGGRAGFGAAATLLSGIALLASELADGRVALSELAGAVVLLKLAVVGAMLLWPASALALFWALLVLSTISSHAPRRMRHWRPGR